MVMVFTCERTSARRHHWSAATLPPLPHQTVSAGCSHAATLFRRTSVLAQLRGSDRRIDNQFFLHPSTGLSNDAGGSAGDNTPPAMVPSAFGRAAGG